VYFGFGVIYARFSSPGKTNKKGRINSPNLQKENPPFSLPV